MLFYRITGFIIRQAVQIVQLSICTATEINFQKLPDETFSSGEKYDITQAWKE